MAPLTRFLLRLATVLAPLAIAFALLEHRLAAVENTYSAKVDRLHVHGPDTRVVVLGSSHMMHGVRPERLGPHGLNMAIISNDIHAESSMANVVASACPHLRAALFEVGDTAFEGSLSDSPESWRVFFLHRYFGVPYERAGNVFDGRNFALSAAYGHDETLNLIEHNFQRRDHSIDDLGFEAAPVHVDPVADAPVAMRRHGASCDVSRIDRNERELIIAIEGLSQHGVRSVLVAPPIHAAYRALIDPARAARRDEAIRRIRGVTGAEYWDFAADPRFETRHFADADHLNLDGADLFSDLLAEKIGELDVAAKSDPATDLVETSRP